VLVVDTNMLLQDQTICAVPALGKAHNSDDILPPSFPNVV
jgi:hypothetical protein